MSGRSPSSKRFGSAVRALFGQAGVADGSQAGRSAAQAPRRSTRRAWLLAVGAASLLGGCLAPTLPLPPPDKPDVFGPDPQGNVTLSGYVPQYALAQAVNLRTGQIAGQATDASGYYEFQLGAQIGDECVFWYNQDTERSPSVPFKIRP